MLSKIIKNSQRAANASAPYSFPEAFSTSPGPGGKSLISARHHHPNDGDATLTLSDAEIAAREQAAYQRGLREAEARFQAEIEALAGHNARILEKSLAAFDQLQKRIFADAEKQVAKLALEIAKKIVRREVRIDDQIVLAMIKVAMSYVSDAHKIKVRVNPADLKIIHANPTKATDYENSAPTPEWVADPAIERGGFVIESDVGMVDGRLGQQFQEIEKSFFGSVQT
jgi:flagellar assembly protein FliH